MKTIGYKLGLQINANCVTFQNTNNIKNNWIQSGQRQIEDIINFDEFDGVNSSFKGRAMDICYLKNKNKKQSRPIAQDKNKPKIMVSTENNFNSDEEEMEESTGESDEDGSRGFTPF